MQHKTFELLETKADDESGSFTALASVFGNIDKGGDRMMKGAFAKTLTKWRQSGKSIPIIVSHQWDDLNAWVGKANPQAIFEDERGLVVQGKLNMDEDGGRKVHRLMKDGLLTGWSFGYSVPKGGQSKKNGANEVTEVELYETGPTLVGMNSEAQLEAVKTLKQQMSVQENHPDCPADRPNAMMDGEDVVSCHATPAEARAAMMNGAAAEPEEKAELNAAYDELGVMREEMKAQYAELDELRNAYDGLKKTSEDRRNEEPKRAKSPSDPLKEESRKAMLAVMRDGNGVPAHTEPSPEAIEAQATRAELVQLRKDYDELKKTSENGRNEEPDQAKSPADSLKEDSRNAMLAVMRDGVPAHIEKSPEPEPEPEPEMDVRELKRESRLAAMSVLKGGLDGK